MVYGASGGQVSKSALLKLLAKVGLPLFTTRLFFEVSESLSRHAVIKSARGSVAKHFFFKLTPNLFDRLH